MTGDEKLSILDNELRSYPGDELTGDLFADSVAVALRVRHDGTELTFISTIAKFGTPLDVTVAELAIESFFPADPEIATLLRGWPPNTRPRGRLDHDFGVAKVRRS